VESSNIIPGEELVSKVSVAIEQILVNGSELKELWDEDEVNKGWHREMDDLAKRVLA